MLVDGAHRAGVNALAAHNAGGLRQALAQRWGYHDFGAPALDAQGVHGLHHAAGLHAAAADNTLILVPDHRLGGVILGIALELQFKGVVPDAVLLDQGLKFTVLVADTVQAVLGMVGEDQFQDHSPGLQHLGAVRHDHHTTGNRGRAGGLQQPLALHLADADPAVGLDGFVRVVAQGGQVDAGRLGCL